MKKLIIVLLMLVLVLPFSAQEDAPGDIIDVLGGLTVSDSAETDTTTLPDLDGRVIRVAAMNTYPPFNQISDEGLAVGWDYDVLAALCGLLNCDPQFVEIEWEGLIPSVRDGVNDMAANGITVTADRAEFLDFSAPYITLHQLLVVRVNEDRFSTVQEFAEDRSLEVMVLAESTNQYAAEDLLGEGNERILPNAGNFEGMVTALIAGETDAIVMDDLAARRFVNATPDALRIIEEPITDVEELAFIFTKGSDLIEPFNLALEAIRADGTLDAINERWLFSES